MADLELSTILYRFGVALAIGALVGIEREATGRGVPPDGPPETGDEPPSGSPQPFASEVRRAISRGEASQIELADHPPPSQSSRLPQLGPRVPLPAPTPSSSPSSPAGIRTFSLIAISGALSAHLTQVAGPWVFVAALVAMAALTVVSYLGTMRQGDLGLTSEVSAVSVFLLGGLCAYGETTLAGSVAVVVTLLLSMKQPLHRFAKRIKPDDIHAVVKFAILTVVILPVLPDEPLRVGQYLPGAQDVAQVSSATPAPVTTKTVAPTPTPTPPAATAAAPGTPQPWWAALTVHPRKIWYMVVLISAISFTGYILGQLLGTDRGLTVTAVVGGMVSSTAVSLSYSQRSQERPELAPQFAIGILLANTIMPLRLLVVVGIIAPALLKYLAMPLMALVAVGAIASLTLHLREKAADDRVQVDLTNPFEIGPAIKFGLLFGIVLFLAQVAQALFSDAGLYGVAVLTGLTDVDAIGLAVANLVADGKQLAVTGAITVTLAVLSNTAVKAYFVATMGTKRLRNIAILAFALMFLAAGLGIVGLWFLARG